MSKRIIISGGGTGGHIYPAISIANALKLIDPTVEILFVGAQGRMEMEKVPALGYRIVGLPVAGLQRRFDLKNLAVPFKVLKSIRKARRTIRDFGADVVVGFGGYASGPVLWAARQGVPTIEINPGDTTVSAIVDHRLRMCAAEALPALWQRMHPAEPAEDRPL